MRDRRDGRILGMVDAGGMMRRSADRRDARWRHDRRRGGRLRCVNGRRVRCGMRSLRRLRSARCRRWRVRFGGLAWSGRRFRCGAAAAAHRCGLLRGRWRGAAGGGGGCGGCSAVVALCLLVESTRFVVGVRRLGFVVLKHRSLRFATFGDRADDVRQS